MDYQQIHNMDWKAEANAVIDDVKPYVASIKVADNKESSDMRIYLSVETLELKKFLVSMDSNGFSICDRDDSSIIYETMNALLDDNSVEYREAFGRALLKKVELLRDNSGDSE